MVWKVAPFGQYALTPGSDLFPSHDTIALCGFKEHAFKRNCIFLYAKQPSRYIQDSVAPVGSEMSHLIFGWVPNVLETVDLSDLWDHDGRLIINTHSTFEPEECYAGLLLGEPNTIPESEVMSELAPTDGNYAIAKMKCVSTNKQSYNWLPEINVYEISMRDLCTREQSRGILRVCVNLVSPRKITMDDTDSRITFGCLTAEKNVVVHHRGELVIRPLETTSEFR